MYRCMCVPVQAWSTAAWTGAPGGYTGGVLPTHRPRARGAHNEELHPGGSLLPGARGYCGRAYGVRRRDGPGYHPCGARSVWPASLPCTQDLAECRLWANKGEIPCLFRKVSQNGIVSPVLVEKASRSPCFQNGSQQSPLDISRKWISPAFSHKELMAHFDPYSGNNVKMTKCRSDVHPWSREVDGQIPPDVTSAS